MFALMNIVVFGRMIFNLVASFPQANNTITPEIFNQLMFIAALGVMSFATRFSIRQTDTAAEEAKVSASLLQAVAESGEILAKMLNLKQLLPRAVELVQERFAFYHVQIFLIDESGEYATLAASTGATGQKLMERRHRLAVGSQSVVGQVTASGLPVVARDTDPIYYRNELLPNTRSELALPITDGDRIIGVLDVQSRRPDAFELESVQALQVMANLVGTSIRNARLFDQQARTANETKRLFLEAETNLREIQRLNQQLTHQGWENYLQSKRQYTGVTLQDEQLVSDTDWSPALAKASQSRQPVTDLSTGQAVIAVPVVLGSEVIGAIEVEPSNPGQEAEVIEMVKAIAQRLAISLDKARLFEESQEATAQEQRINDIVARYQTVTNVDDLLQITLSELSTSLGAKRGAIRLGSVPAASLTSMNGESQHD
jgi:GAF domain-containing protein